MAAILLTKTTDQLFTLDPDKNEYKELTGTAQYKKNRIGELKKIVVGFTSDTDISGMNCYFDPALFMNSGTPQPFTNIVPANCYALTLDAAATPGTYDMVLSAQVPYPSDLIKNESAQIEIVDANTFNLIFIFYQIYDTNNYLNPASEQNRFKLLKDRVANPAILSAVAPSVYTDAKVRPRVYIFLQDPADPVSTLGSLYVNIDNFQAGFYSKDELNADPYFTNPLWIFNNNAGDTVVPGLLMSENTRVKFRITSPVEPSEVMVWMIKTSANDNTVDMFNAYDASFYKVITSNSNLQKSNKIWTPSAKFYADAGDFECFFTVKNTSLVFGDKYRFISVVYYRDDDYSLYEVNSFISDEYTVEALPKFTGDGYNINGKITDYLNEYTGNDLVCVIEERLKGSVEIDYSSDAFANDMLSRLGLTVPNDIKRYLKKVTVEVYQNQGGGVTQFFERLVSNKIDPINYSAAPGLTLDFQTDVLTLLYDFRVRYESWIANIETRVGSVSLITPNDTQNWQGRVLVIEYSLELFYDDFTTPFSDVLKFRQTIRPKNYSKDVNILNEADDSEIGANEYYCIDSDPCFKAKLANTVVDPDEFVLLTTAEKEPGLSSSVEENEEFAGDLPQLDSNKFINQESNFGTTETKVAKFCLDSSNFFVDSPYKVSVIAKKNVPPCARITEDSIIRVTEDDQIRITENCS